MLIQVLSTFFYNTMFLSCPSFFLRVVEETVAAQELPENRVHLVLQDHEGHEDRLEMKEQL